MERIFENKVALVTGASFGIGRATAVAFARRGAKVALVDNVADEQTIDAIKALGGEAVFFKCDVSINIAVKKMVEDVMTEFGRIDFAFNNAGIEGLSAPLHECTEENWDKTLGINLKGIWLCMKYEIPHMLQSGHGAIVNCASIAGLVGFPGLPAYVASKHAVVGITKTAALENAKTGIRINAVCPGVIKTPMVDRLTGHDKMVEKGFEAAEPIGRFGQPDEVAEAVIWLCSESASFVTGHALAVDGGWIAQ
jgi:NAD(P)-dependent dehydrogenase (short-subunit alcohol dehydrogenase family)